MGREARGLGLPGLWVPFWPERDSRKRSVPFVVVVVVCVVLFCVVLLFFVLQSKHLAESLK